MQARLAPLTLVDVAELSRVDEPFVELTELGGRPLVWKRHSGLPTSAIERRITRPRLSRYRAAWHAAGDMRGAAGIISHLPRMTAAVADFARLRRRSAPHLAFAFNFTDLPAGAERARFGRRLGGVDQFCTFTRFEAALYADAFGLPVERFRPTTWTQAMPATIPLDPAMLPPMPFVVAIGGEGRDFATLLAAAKALPSVRFVIIARPDPALLSVPSNVLVQFNLAPALCWSIALHAAAVLVPLRSAETCCGHITLVSGRMLGLPIVTTASRGTDEYTRDFAGTHLIEPGNVEGWTATIDALVKDPAPAKAAASHDARTALERYDRRRWAGYIADFIERHMA